MSRRLLSATILALALCASPNVLRAQQAPVPVAINTVIQAPTVLSAAGTVTVATGGLPAVGLTIQGTGSGITAAVQGQATPGGIWTTISAVPYGGGAAVTSISANGFWTINVSAYVAVRLNATALASGNLGVVFGSATPLAITVVNPDGTLVGGSSTSPAQVKIVAGQNGIGNVGGKTVSVCTTPTVTVSNAYGVNYVVGGLQTFANAFTSTGSGILQGVVVTINDLEMNGFTFFPFNANPSNTTWTDAAVSSIAATDVAKVRNPVLLTGNNQLKSTVFSVYSAAGLGEALAPGTTSLYGVLIANAALTNDFAGTSDVQVCVKILDDE